MPPKRGESGSAGEVSRVQAVILYSSGWVEHLSSSSKLMEKSLPANVRVTVNLSATCTQISVDFDRLCRTAINRILLSVQDDVIGPFRANNVVLTFRPEDARFGHQQNSINGWLNSVTADQFQACCPAEHVGTTEAKADTVTQCHCIAVAQQNPLLYRPSIHRDAVQWFEGITLSGAPNPGMPTGKVSQNRNVDVVRRSSLAQHDFIRQTGHVSANTIDPEDKSVPRHLSP